MKKAAAAGMIGLLTAATHAAGESSAPPGPGLAEFMLVTQTRHLKLWLAGSARNWELADYQIDELKEGFEDAVKHYPKYGDIPVGSMIESLMTGPVGEVEDAIKARNSAKFVAAYDKLTTACNSCHEAANRGFIVILRPTSSPFPNQSFSPRRK